MNRNFFFLSLFVIAATTAAVFYPSLSAGFVTIDDPVMVSANNDIMRFDWPAVKHWFTSFHYNLYHPLVSMSYALEYRLFGADPYVYHATNVILHILNGMLVLVFFQLLTGRRGLSLLIALLFAVHPLHVESVAWITERKDVLYAFFFLWAMILYCWHIREGRKTGYILAMLFFLLSLLSKSMAVSFPLVALLIDMHQGGTWDRRMAARQLPFWALAAIFSIATYLGYYPRSLRTSFTLYDVLNNTMVAAYNVFFYLGKLILPINLTCVYPKVVPYGEIPPLTVRYAPAALAMLATAVCWSVRRDRRILFGLGFFAVTILPVINLLPTGISPLADRYTYIPYLGLFYAGAVAAYAGLRRLPWLPAARQGAVVLSIAMIGLLGMIARARCTQWQNNLSLFSSGIRAYPAGAFAYNGRGLAYQAAGDPDRAFADFSAGIALDPRSSVMLMNRGVMYLKRKEYAAAFADFSTASSIGGSYALSLNYLGLWYMENKDYPTALRYYARARAYDPDMTGAWLGTALVHILQKKNDQALKVLTEMRVWAPHNQDAMKMLAKLYIDTDRLPEAEGICQAFLRDNPEDADVRNLLGTVYGKEGRIGDAIREFSRAIRSRPNFSQAWHNRGNMWAMQKNLPVALGDYTASVGLDRSFGEAYFKRAIVYGMRREFTLARADVAHARANGYAVPADFLRQLRSDSSIPSGPRRRQ